VLQFVGHFHDLRERLDRSQPHLGGLAVAKELLAGPGEEGMDGQVDHVDQLRPQQRLREEAVAEDQQVSSFLPLEPRYLGDGVARTMVELSQSALSSVELKTYFGMAFIRSAQGWTLPP
jgi:hypothetical protein